MNQPTLDAYIEAVASSAPAPGGGSVVAVVAALAAALGEMVCNLTLGRPTYAAAEAECAAAKARLATLRGHLLAAASDDEIAYRDYRAAAAQSKGSDQERERRLVAMQGALVTATEVPLAVAAACVEIALALEPVARLGNGHALVDAQIGALLAGTALTGALLNVRGNAAMLRDPEVATGYQERANDLERSGAAAVQVVLDRARERTAASSSAR